MKIASVTLVLLIFLACTSYAQTVAVQELKKYCDVNLEFFPELPDGVAAELVTNQIDKEHKFPTGFLQLIKSVDVVFDNPQKVIPINEMSGYIWSLVSKQLNGNEGALQLTEWNCFPTSSKIWERSLVTVWWNPTQKKWVIGMHEATSVKCLYEEVKMFTY